MDEPVGHTIDGTPWDEARGPHLPDPLTRFHQAAAHVVGLRHPRRRDSARPGARSRLAALASHRDGDQGLCQGRPQRHPVHPPDDRHDPLRGCPVRPAPTRLDDASGARCRAGPPGCGGCDAGPERAGRGGSSWSWRHRRTSSTFLDTRADRIHLDDGRARDARHVLRRSWSPRRAPADGSRRRLPRDRHDRARRDAPRRLVDRGRRRHDRAGGGWRGRCVLRVQHRRSWRSAG